jgi:hypothetical protein
MASRTPSSPRRWATARTLSHGNIWCMLFVFSAFLLFNIRFLSVIPDYLPTSLVPAPVGQGGIPKLADLSKKNNVTSTTTGERLPLPPSPSTPDFQIIILTMDRFSSLQRLVDSLKATDYGSDTVDLLVRFDRPKTPSTEFWAAADAFRANLTWSAGQVTVTMAKENMGLRAAWLAAWRPTSVTERALILEDDIEVSPLWYRWMQGAYEAYGHRTDIAGLSLQRQTLVPLKSQRQNGIPDHDGLPFLYKLVGSIGYAPLAAKWMDFLDFAECALATDLAVRTPELVTSDWYDKLDQRGMWTQLFIYFCKYYDLYTLYDFPTDHRALAAHWREKGEHYGVTGGRDFGLVEGAKQVRWEFPLDLPRLDWNARPTQGTSLRSLVLSAAVGYTEKEFERFVRNLRQHYDGDVAVLVWQGAPRVIFTLLEENHIQVVTTREPGGPRASALWYKVNEVRWQFYQDACREADYDLCMAVDFRDTLFQDDPFRGMKAEAGAVLHVYEHNLVMNGWHLDVAWSCKGRNEELKKKMIINAGGFVGSPKVFPQLAWAILEDGKGCDDQVALNLGVYGKRLNATIHSHAQTEGSINNVGWGGKVHRDGRNRFLNGNCFPSPTVHQFDMVKR